ncbi:MAG: hypothetical protein CMB77_01180 [Euryarchaeota archaeon]|nr:hypothetical protein [Euryarchaeota archaeon]
MPSQKRPLVDVDQEDSMIHSWHDPEGGTIDLLPYLPSVEVQIPKTRRVWTSVAILDDPSVLDAWHEEAKIESRSRGANAAALIASGGPLGWYLDHLQTVEGVESGRFPDPLPYGLWNRMQRSPRFLIEPSDEEWDEWILAKADHMVRFRNLLTNVGAHRRFKKRVKAHVKAANVPGEGGLQQAHASLLAWWESVVQRMGDHLSRQRDGRFAARLRGSLSWLRSAAVGNDEPRLLVPVVAPWAQDILFALEQHPKPEKIEPFSGDEESGESNG